MRILPQRSYYYILIGLLLGLTGCGKHQIKPKLVSGKLDLTSYHFEKSGLVQLNGEWEFYWQNFYVLEDFQKTSPQLSGLIEVPQSWNSFKYQPPKTKGRKPSSKQMMGTAIGGKGYATYRCMISLPHKNMRLALKIPPISTAYKLYVGKQLMSSTGGIGKSKQAEVPDHYPSIIELTNHSHQLELILQVSNHHHTKGGIRYPLRLGLKSQISQHQKGINIITFFLIGSILIMALHHIGIYWTRRKSDSTLYFGLICLASVFRLLIIDEYFIKDFYYFSWATTLRLEYLTMNAAVIPMVLMLNKLFPKEISKWFVNTLAVIFSLLTVLVLLLPPELFAQTLPISQIVILLGGLYTFVRVIQSVLRQREGALLYMIGYTFFLISIINDVLYNQDVINTGNFFAVGVFAFIFFQALLLARRFSKAFQRAERFSSELNYTNRNLERLVEVRTKDLKESNTKLNEYLVELDAINEKLMELDRFKQQMMGMIVHDLKNPLNSIIGLSSQQQDPRFFENIHQSGQRMYHLVMNILDVQKFEESKMQLQIKDVLLEEIVNEAVQQTNYVIQEKQHQVILHLLPDTVIKADREISTRVLINLLTNAAKYTPYGGQIDIFVEDESAFYKVLVKDSGVGIPKEQLEKIFDKFHQVTQKKLGRTRSTGLGLTFCKLAIEAQEGTIGVSSERNKGATFWFTIPKGKLTSLDAQNDTPHEGRLDKPTILQTLSDREKDLLFPVIQKIAGLEIYQTSKIKEALMMLKDSDSERIQYWINEIEDTLFAHNEQRLQALLNIIDR
ncbi:MAG TPA: hypothetical protein DCS93_29835 [Microscillaceae bacterium]|nr:hypothetical protein [Microscillaceae bacterium]